MKLKDWLRKRRLERAARRLVAAAIRSPEARAGTSLQPRHAARTVVVDLEAEGDRVARVWFGILRHPRPYGFSRQCHRVVEYYLYEAGPHRITRIEGVNLTRRSGRDAD